MTIIVVKDDGAGYSGLQIAFNGAIRYSFFGTLQHMSWCRGIHSGHISLCDCEPDVVSTTDKIEGELRTALTECFQNADFIEVKVRNKPATNLDVLSGTV